MSEPASHGNLPEVRIRPFHPSMEEEARGLILAGLVERFGFHDPARNPDLCDIGETYAGATFLVAVAERRIVGTGALVRESAIAGRIVRMSVARSLRRQGIGSRILAALTDAARAAGYRNLLVETTADWHDAIAFYGSKGFELLGVDEERQEAYFQRSLLA